MKLEYLMTFSATLKPLVEVGEVVGGARAFAEVVDGVFEGPRLKGRLATGGGDWLLIDQNGMGHVDVRAILSTHDGANIYAQYLGRLEMNEKIQAAFATGESTEFGEGYFMTSPRFEVGDARYSWLNDKVCVAEGRVYQGGVEYRCYTLEN